MGGGNTIYCCFLAAFKMCPSCHLLTFALKRNGSNINVPYAPCYSKVKADSSLLNLYYANNSYYSLGEVSVLSQSLT
jgi:hypothetical protein